MEQYLNLVSTSSLTDLEKLSPDLVFQIAEYQDGKTPSALYVNFDPELLLLLREVNYLAAPPFSIHLTDAVRMLLRNTDVNLLRSTATHLETIVSRYNDIMITIKDTEWPLFEIKINRINEVRSQVSKVLRIRERQENR